MNLSIGSNVTSCLHLYEDFQMDSLTIDMHVYSISTYKYNVQFNKYTFKY